jgi:hypothetical protein
MSDGHETDKIESVLHRSPSDHQPSVQDVGVLGLSGPSVHLRFGGNDTKQ